MMKSFVAWAESVDGTIDHTELKVVSKTHKYSGTFDAVGKIGKTRLLIDWKTGSSIYSDMDLQLVAYAQAYNEMTGSKIKDGLIVHVSKDKPHFKLKTKQFKLGKRVFKKFLELREMFDAVVTANPPQVGSL
jgi:CRISPR/Cas system-associated exonuclease Cas4 (RecB family)